MSTIYSPFVNELKEKMEFEGAFLVKVIQLQLDKNGRAYLNLVVMDRTGEIEARIWDNATKIAEDVKPQDVVRLAGKVNSYQGRKQLVIDAIVKVQDSTYPLDRFLPSTFYDVNKLFEDMLALMSTITNPFVKELALRTLKDPEIQPRLKRAPAAKSVHHAYAGGLLEHALSVCRILDGLAGHYKNYYGPALSRDHLLIGGLFHDIGKIYELSFDKATEYTREGQLIGHLIIGCEMIDRIAATIPDFPPNLKMEIKHLVLSHHGKMEYGSPKLPHMIEGLIVHYMDDLDSKINTILGFITADQQPGEFTQNNRSFERPFLKPAVKPSFTGQTPGRA